LKSEHRTQRDKPRDKSMVAELSKKGLASQNGNNSYVYLDHRESPASSSNGIALACVRFLSDAELVKLLLKAFTVNGGRCRSHGYLLGEV
jgi:hypothetical protein